MSHSDDPRRALPSVDQLLHYPQIRDFENRFSQEFLTLVCRDQVAKARERLTDKGQNANEKQIIQKIVSELNSFLSISPRRVINATGVVLHTGLGRAPLSPKAIEALTNSAGYCDLEFDLASGNRGDRQQHIESLLCLLTGAEASMVVNNNAASIFLVLNTLAAKKEVIVSRGQLIEIGGSFRLPDIMRRAGVKLVEVGTTNRTRVSDFREAINLKTGMLMRAYPSNYLVSGFTESVGIKELSILGKEFDLPVIDDLGGGLLRDWTDLGLPYEPNVRESLGAGADLVLVSGDKVIGGPQSGIIVGKKALIAKLRKSPLARVLRADKFTLSALRATLTLFLDKEHLTEHNEVWRMLTVNSDTIRLKAERIKLLLIPLSKWESLGVFESASEAGSGTLPAVPIASYSIYGLPAGHTPSQWAKELRKSSVPVITTIRDNKVWMDMRTVSEQDESQLISSVKESLARSK